MRPTPSTLTRMAPISGSLLIITLLAACQSGPTANDFMNDAQKAVANARYEEAKTYVDLAEEHGLAERDILLMRAKIRRKSAEKAKDAGDLERAHERYIAAGDIDPRRVESAKLYIQAIEIGQKLGYPAEQLAQLAQKAVEEDPSSATAHRMTAQHWDEAGQSEKALRHYLWLWKSDASSPRIGRRLANIYAALDRPEDAITVLEDVTSQDAESIQAYVNLAQLYARTGQRRRARRTYEQLIEDHPKNSGILLQYGRFLEQQGQVERARRLKKRAYENMPGVEAREMRELQ